MLYEDLRIGPKFFISNRAQIFFGIFGDGPADQPKTKQSHSFVFLSQPQQRSHLHL
ncbi:hypothetical protein Hanom_Chr14g01273701 [Helianthus anomalus]